MGRTWAGWAGVVATLLHDTRRPDAGSARFRGPHAVAREAPAARLTPSRAAVAGELDALGGLGPTADASAWLHLAAPGVNPLSCPHNNRYGTKTATSMACPRVSGTAAMAG